MSGLFSKDIADQARTYYELIDPMNVFSDKGKDLETASTETKMMYLAHKIAALHDVQGMVTNDQIQKTMESMTPDKIERFIRWEETCYEYLEKCTQNIDQLLNIDVNLDKAYDENLDETQEVLTEWKNRFTQANSKLSLESQEPP